MTRGGTLRWIKELDGTVPYLDFVGYHGIGVILQDISVVMNSLSQEAQTGYIHNARPHQLAPVSLSHS